MSKKKAPPKTRVDKLKVGDLLRLSPTSTRKVTSVSHRTVSGGYVRYSLGLGHLSGGPALCFTNLRPHDQFERINT